MIYEIMCYGGKCDGCGETWNNFDGIAYWNDRSNMEESLANDEWHTEGDKHYCPNCHSIDDDDNVIITPAKSLHDNGKSISNSIKSK